MEAAGDERMTRSSDGRMTLMFYPSQQRWRDDVQQTGVLAKLEAQTKLHFEADFPTIVYRDMKIHSELRGMGKASEIQQCLSTRWPCMQEPFFDNEVHQQMLARILCKLANEKPRLGHNEYFATFVGGILALMQNEARTYKIAAIFYERHLLDDYFAIGVKEYAFEEDVEKTLSQIDLLHPDISETVERLDCVESLRCLVRGLLRSLLMQGYREDAQPFVCLAPLLHRLLVAEVAPQDPRRFLRHATACMVGRHLQDSENCCSAQEFGMLCRNLRNAMSVDEALLRLIDFDLDGELALSICSWSSSPIPAAACALAVTPMLASVSAPLFVAGIAAATVFGAASGYALGHVQGTLELGLLVQYILDWPEKDSNLSRPHQTCEFLDNDRSVAELDPESDSDSDLAAQGDDFLFDGIDGICFEYAQMLDDAEHRESLIGDPDRGAILGGIHKPLAYPAKTKTPLPTIPESVPLSPRSRNRLQPITRAATANRQENLRFDQQPNEV